MKSHEYAQKLADTARFLLSRPEFETEMEPWVYLGNYWTDKDKFLAAVKALGAGVKEWGKDDLTFKVKSPAEIVLSIQRSAVCRKIQEEKWECEPLLSPEEEAQIGVGT